MADWMAETPVLATVLTVLLKSVCTLLGAWLLIRFGRFLANKFFQRRLVNHLVSDGRLLTLKKLVDNVINTVIMFIAVVTILGFLGINVASILAAAGVLGLAVGFGAQTLVKDVISGFFLILENQIAVGERVTINSFEGYVEAVEMRVTRVKGLKGELFIVPNGSITQVINYSRYPSTVSVTVTFSRRSDLETINTLVTDVVDQYREAYRDRVEAAAVLQGAEAVNDDAVSILVTAEVEPIYEEEVKRDLIAAINEILAVREDAAPFTIK